MPMVTVQDYDSYYYGSYSVVLFVLVDNYSDDILLKTIYTQT